MATLSFAEFGFAAVDEVFAEEEETFAIDLDPERDLPPCDDDEFALFAADVITQSVDCPADFQSGDQKVKKIMVPCKPCQPCKL